MRLDSPFVLAFAGTVAIHTILVVTADAVTFIYPHHDVPPAPRVELVDIVPEPPPEPPKPPPPAVEQPKPPEPKTVDRPEPVKTRVPKQVTQPPPTEEPPKQEAPVQDTTPGGDEVVQMADIAPSAHGVAVKVGKSNNGQHVGRGGSGGGTGAGQGSGTEDVPPPVSVATIKKRAMPKGDYSYFNTGGDYPLEAKQLGIEGDIRARLIVDDQGKVKRVDLLNRLGHGLDELALARAKQIEFDPAKDTDDKAVTSVVVWTFHMTLPK